MVSTNKDAETHVFYDPGVSFTAQYVSMHVHEENALMGLFVYTRACGEKRVYTYNFYMTLLRETLFNSTI